MREFFEHHRTSVLFVGFKKNTSLTMVTLDNSGVLALWPYTESNFTGYGWYRPEKVRQ
ncbi:unnamed protein product, partial [Choristocarpus tenellus]